MEYIIWGIPVGSEHETVLHTQSKTPAEARNVMKVIETKFGAKKLRLQVLDPNVAPDFSSKKIFNRGKK